MTTQPSHGNCPLKNRIVCWGNRTFFSFPNCSSNISVRVSGKGSSVLPHICDPTLRWRQRETRQIQRVLKLPGVSWWDHSKGLLIQGPPSHSGIIHNSCLLDASISFYWVQTPKWSVSGRICVWSMSVDNSRLLSQVVMPIYLPPATHENSFCYTHCQLFFFLPVKHIFFR